MIDKDIKISQLLKMYPHTLEILTGITPHFKKLNNPILRRTLAKRVTIEQAAAIAGVDLLNMLKVLNESIGVKFNESKINMDGNKMERPNEKPDIIKNTDASKFVNFDVRPIINSGTDPFLDIMEKVKSLKDDEILVLINSFEPVPLYTVLGKKGFEHWTIFEDGVYKVHFYRTGKSQNEEREEKSSANENEIENVIELDVRELEPPEPMMKILEKLNEIDDRTILLVHHHREPMMLYPKLEERGFEAITNKIEENYYKVVIKRK